MDDEYITSLESDVCVLATSLQNGKRYLGCFEWVEWR
jgi:hypothetical protein